MKRAIIIIAILISLAAAAAGQTRVSRIYRPCSGSTTPASVSIARDGSISIAPCSGKLLTSPGVPVVARLSSNLSLASNATPADTALSITVPAAGNYDIDLVLHGTESAGGLRFDFGGTATVGYFVGQWSAMLIDGTSPKGARVTAAGTDFTDITLAGQDTIYTFRGSAEFSTAGTFTVRAAQSASNGFASVVERGSTLKLTKSN